jgi:hypothetical protein
LPTGINIFNSEIGLYSKKKFDPALTNDNSQNTSGVKFNLYMIANARPSKNLK